jgi:hypothetical protein
VTDISLQFHATPEELLPLVRAYLVEEGDQASAARYPPFGAALVDRAELDSVFADPSVGRIIMTAYTPELAVGGMMEFLDRNPSALQLHLGRNSPAGLEESWLTGRTDDKERLQTWKKLLSKIRAITRTGVVAFDPATGATAAVKAHRFSDGAKALEREGVPILTAAGKPRLKFGD